MPHEKCWKLERHGGILIRYWIHIEWSWMIVVKLRNMLGDRMPLLIVFNHILQPSPLIWPSLKRLNDIQLASWTCFSSLLEHSISVEGSTCSMWMSQNNVRDIIKLATHSGGKKKKMHPTRPSLPAPTPCAASKKNKCTIQIKILILTHLSPRFISALDAESRRFDGPIHHARAEVFGPHLLAIPHDHAPKLFKRASSEKSVESNSKLEFPVAPPRS